MRSAVMQSQSLLSHFDDASIYLQTFPQLIADLHLCLPMCNKHLSSTTLSPSGGVSVVVDGGQHGHSYWSVTVLLSVE